MSARCSAGAEMAGLRKEKKLTQAELAQRIGTELGFSWTDFFSERTNKEEASECTEG